MKNIIEETYHITISHETIRKHLLKIDSSLYFRDDSFQPSGLLWF